MRILIVDDEQLALDRLRAGLAAIDGIAAIETARDGLAAQEAVAQFRPDLVLLDVQMPGATGVEVASALATRPNAPDVIFVTAFDRYASQAYDVEAIDYLLKPVRFDRLRVTIARARRRQVLRAAEERIADLELAVKTLLSDAPPEAVADASGHSTHENAIWVPGRQGAIRVPVDTIDWIEAARDYVLLNTPTKSHMLRATMGEMERMLDPALLLRVHRSHIVRLGAVTGVQRPGKGVLWLLLADGATLQVGPSYQEAVLDALRLRRAPA